MKTRCKKEWWKSATGSNRKFICSSCAYLNLSHWIFIELKNQDTPFNSRHYAKIQEGKLPQTVSKLNLNQSCRREFWWILRLRNVLPVEWIHSGGKRCMVSQIIFMLVKNAWSMHRSAHFKSIVTSLPATSTAMNSVWLLNRLLFYVCVIPIFVVKSPAFTAILI